MPDAACDEVYWTNDSMAKFKVPSPTPSPTSSGGSSSPRRSPTGTLRPRSPREALRPKKLGRIGKFQGNRAMPTCREEPGKKPVWSTARVNEPGLNWNNGAVYWMHTRTNDPARPLDRRACREIIDERDELDLTHAENARKILQHPHIVRLIDHDGFDTLDTRKDTVWEHCDAGTLNRLILAQKGEGLPESLVWHTIMSLLEAVVYLSTGESVMEGNVTDPFVDPAPGWKPIAHNLINPANIFYCHPRKEAGYKKPTYGLCKLGNFSRCIAFRHEDERLGMIELLDKDVEGEFTGYEAPELSGHSAEARLSADGVSDVWSIGAVALTMMTGRSIWKYVMREHIDEDMPSRWDEAWRTVDPKERFDRLDAMTLPWPGCQQLEWVLPDTYSKPLRRLVQRMLRLVDLDDDDVQRGREPPGVFCMEVANLFIDAMDVAKGTDEEDEYILDGEPESESESDDGNQAGTDQ